MDEEAMFKFFDKIKKAIRVNPLDEENDVKKFPLKIKIKDDKALLMVAEGDKLREEAIALHRALDIKKKQIDLINSKLFERLYSIHDVQTEYDCHGIRKYKNDVYLVSYNEPVD